MNKTLFTVEELLQLPIINVHAHLKDPEDLEQHDLTALLSDTYLSWAGVAIPKSAEESSEFFYQFKHNSKLRYFKKAIQKIYNKSEPFSQETWDMYNAEVVKAYSTKGKIAELYDKFCNYTYVLNDAHWNPGATLENLNIHRPSYRITMYLFGYSPNAKDHNDRNPFTFNNWSTDMSFDTYLEKIEQEVIKKKESGCVALKNSIAYNRDFCFDVVEKEKAALAFLNKDATPEQIRDFQSYMFYYGCELSAKYDMPLQIHTGGGVLLGTNAANLKPAIVKNPKTKFMLMHGNYPWTDELCMLAHNYANVYLDMSPLAYITPSRTLILLKELIEVGLQNKLMWGCDTRLLEESFASLIAFLDVLCELFTEIVNKGDMTMEEAKEYIADILGRNAALLYGLEL